jgi:hypothetical protein
LDTLFVTTADGRPPTTTVLVGSIIVPQLANVSVAVIEPVPDPIAVKTLGLPGLLSNVIFELQFQVTS